MNNLQVFKNEAFGEIRTVEISGKPYFVAGDIAKSLGYSNTRDAISRHCKGVVKHDIGVQTGSKADGSPAMQNIKMNCIPEGDIYRLIAHSELPSAEKFESWVFDEVLPGIRKHGVYATESTLDKILSNPEFGIRLLTSLKEEREKNKILEQRNEEMKPKVLFADAVSASDTSILVRDLAKLIRQNGVEIGERRLYVWMREHGYICKRSTMPTQKAMEMELFEIVVRTIERGNGLPLETKTAKVTGKGQVYFVQKFLVA